MFVCVDIEALQFTHKHRVHEIVSGLAFLEACDRSTLVDSTENEHFLKNLNPLNCRWLYRNTCGEDITGTPDLVVRQMLAALVAKLPTTLAVQDDLDAQIEAVQDDLHAGKPWKYALGAKKPIRLERLDSLHCKPLTNEEAEQAALQAPQLRAERAAPKPAATASAAPQPAPAPRKARAHSVRPVIWAVADSMWEAAGKPMDKAVVLELRKKMMTELEEKHSVKRTSSSNELGNWMKDRLA